MSIGYRDYRRIVIFLIFLGIIVFYSFFQTRRLREGPIINLKSPESSLRTANSEVLISGNIKNSISRTINDRILIVDEFGNFSEKLLVPYGYTIITLRAEDRFGKKTEKKIDVFLEKNLSSSVSVEASSSSSH